ncbi:MAG: ABC transporter ATP-binding protein [Rhodospirillales bacterium]|nr:ABC transporter ATP-binding protein [Rhodospirillales bacterium]
MSDVILKDVTKRWDDVVAVKQVSFTAKGSELLVILGPSGCGKSTVLRMIAGLEEVSEGQIFIAGRDVTAKPASKRNISMVFQSYALFPHMTVADNILFGLQFHKVPKSEQNSRLAIATEMLSLQGLENRKPAQLSGGQRQRVALGRAIVAQAPVCLMDEPLSNLDAKLRNAMRLEIRALQQRLGMTMAYVTHDQTEAMSMADQIVLLNDGEVVQIGSPVDIYDNPASVFAARFIGTPPMNILSLAATGDGLATPGENGITLVRGKENDALLGVRPEHVRIVEKGGLSATVANSEFLGADTLISCQIGCDVFLVRHPDRFVVKPGDRVRLAWDHNKSHIFNANDGLRRDDLRQRINPIQWS